MPRKETVFWVIAYSISSSSLLVVNKMAVDVLGTPALVSGAQLLTSAIAVLIMEACGCRVLGPFERKRILPMILFTISFAAGLYANVKALLYTNVGAIIGARCAVPLLVCSFEFAFMGKAFPDARNLLSLAGVLSAAVFYINADTGLQVSGPRGVFWLTLQWVLLAINATYGKHLTEKIEMSQWERVFYTNAFAVPPTILFYVASREFDIPITLTKYSVFVLTISCIFGLAISFCGWNCRSVVSATTFALIGVLNKMATILLNILVWPTEFTVQKTAALLTCILFGLLYR